MATAQPLLHAQARLGEGAIWDTRVQKLWWVDINGRELHCFDPETKRDQVWAMPSTIGTVVPRARGGVVVALKNIIAAFDPETASLTTLAGIDQVDQRFNDGKCDPVGRLWVGTINSQMTPGVAALYRLDERGINSQIPGITISNGIVWSQDGRTCWYIDTPTRRVDAFDYDVAAGRLSNRRPAIIFPDGDFYPDGMTIDEHGHLWVAMWGGGCVLHCDPRSGRILGRIEIPGASKITSCAFGGAHLDTLYITSAGGGEAVPAGDDESTRLLLTAARQLGLEVVRLMGLNLPEALLRMVPSSIALTYRVVPVRLEDRTLVLATSNSEDPQTARDLAPLLKVARVRFALADDNDLNHALDRYYRTPAASIPPESNAGDLFVAHPGVRGVPSTPFAN